MEDRDLEEHVLTELAIQFRKLLKAKVNGSNSVVVDFTNLPEKWVFAIRGSVASVEYKNPPTVKVMDLIRSTMPGIYGYVNNDSKIKKEVICTCCGKVHKNKK